MAECLDPLPTVEAKAGSGCLDSGYSLLCGILPVHSLQLSKQLKWQALYCFYGEVWAFPGEFLASTFPGKLTLGGAQNCWPDVANWMGLTQTARDYSEASPNGLCDCTLFALS